MKIKKNEFKKKAFFIPLHANGEWASYKQFSSQQWEKNILMLLRMSIVSSNTDMPLEKTEELAKEHLERLLFNIRQNLTPEQPCLVLGNTSSQSWFIAFVVEAFIPFDNKDSYNVFNLSQHKTYAHREQNVEIAKVKGDPLEFAYNLIKTTIA